jgi:hypothetical protein
VHRGKGGHRRVEDALGNLVARSVEDGIGGHEMPHVAHQHQAAPVQGQRLAV